MQIIKTKPDFPHCTYNAGVCCHPVVKKCDNCGWNPAVENQATDRAYRIGQHRNVLVHKFVCRGTLEERIDRMIREKTRLAETLLHAGGEKLLTDMSNDELMAFVQCDTESFL